VKPTWTVKGVSDSEDPKTIQQAIAKAANAIIRQPSEALGGLIADQVNYYRWRSAVSIMERAKAIREQKGLGLNAVPLKVFIPLIEEGSKEAEDDDEMLDLWANLLAQSDEDVDAIDLQIIDVLRKITGKEAKLLRRMPVEMLGDISIPIIRDRISDFLEEKFDRVFVHSEINDTIMDEMIGLAGEISKESDILILGDFEITYGIKYWRLERLNDKNNPSILALKNIGIIQSKKYNFTYPSEQYGRVNDYFEYSSSAHFEFSVEFWTLSPMG
jgi:hypothetical protein